MKILLLHDLMSARPLRRQLANQALFFAKYRPETEVVLHAVGDPADEALRGGDFDASFLAVSLLCWRWAKPVSVFEALLRDYAWVATHPAVKSAPSDSFPGARNPDTRQRSDIGSRARGAGAARSSSGPSRRANRKMSL